MDKSVYLVSEFLTSAKISRGELKEWELAHLLRPAGVTDQNQPFYTDASLERVAQVQKLLDLGYSIDDIGRIVQKVGLPRTNPTRKSDEGKWGKLLTVGQLSSKTGLSARTLKHWEEKGIIQPDTRSNGGFRLYAEYYVLICKLIQDLQFFGYSLEEIRRISDYFRDFLALSSGMDHRPKADVAGRLDEMLTAIEVLHKKMAQLEEGIRRWKIFLRRKDSEINELVSKNQKRPGRTVPKTEGRK